MLLGNCKPLIGVVHLPPLPGSPGYKRFRYPRSFGKKWTFEEIVEYAIEEAGKYEEAGFDAVIIENYGDKPYTIRANTPQAMSMALIVREVTRNIKIPVGVNILRNSVYEALHVAYLSKAKFVRANSLCEVRVSPEGIIEPGSKDLARAVAELDIYDDIEQGKIMILADVNVKHSHPLGQSDTLAIIEDCVTRIGIPIAAIIVTGQATGQPPSPEQLTIIREQASKQKIPVIIGSGINHENISSYWPIADGFIVGTSVKLGGQTENVVNIDAAIRLAKLVSHYRKEWKC